MEQIVPNSILTVHAQSYDTKYFIFFCYLFPFISIFVSEFLVFSAVFASIVSHSVTVMYFALLWFNKIWYIQCKEMAKHEGKNVTTNSNYNKYTHVSSINTKTNPNERTNKRTKRCIEVRQNKKSIAEAVTAAAVKK